MGRRKKRLWPETEAVNRAALRELSRHEKGGTNMKVWPWNEPADSKTVKSVPVDTRSTFGMGSVVGYHVKPQCTHDGKQVLFTLPINDAQFTFGGAKGMQIMNDGGPPKNTILIVDLAGQADLKPPRPVYYPWFKSGPAQFASLEPPKPAAPVPLDIPILRLDWADQQAPPQLIGPVWWKLFLSTLATSYPGGGHVIVCCIGSHGRTGTALAAIALAGNQKLSLAKAAEMVRVGHCERTIESSKQWRYLATFREDETLPGWITQEMCPIDFNYTGPHAPAFKGVKYYGGDY